MPTYSTHPKGDYKEGDEVRSVQRLTFRGDEVEEQGKMPVGTYGTVNNYDDSDNTWLVTWHWDGKDTAFWIDPECFDYDKISDEEMDEVYSIFGVANPNK